MTVQPHTAKAFEFTLGRTLPNGERGVMQHGTESADVGSIPTVPQKQIASEAKRRTRMIGKIAATM